MVNETSDIGKLVYPLPEAKVWGWIDRAEKIMDVAWPAGLAFLGYRTFNHPAGALYGLTAAKLATNTGGGGTFGNASRIAGLAMLGFLGAMQIPATLGPPGQDLPSEQIVNDVDTGRPTKFVLTRTDAGWQYVRAEGEPAPIVGPRMEYSPGAQVGEYIPTDNPYL